MTTVFTTWALVRPLFIILLISVTSFLTAAWTTVVQQPAMTMTTRYPGGEVIGSTGKVGSYILHRLNEPSAVPIPAIPSSDDDDDRHRYSANSNEERYYPQSQNAAAVPRGVAPGCLSPDGAPLYACTTSSSITDVWSSTLPHRRKDLVFLCNCVPSRHLVAPWCDPPGDVTVAILHFGVSHDHHDCASSSSSQMLPTPRLHQSPTSPPTVVYGRHAIALGELLRRDGVHVVIARSPREVQVAAARKLAWSSLMWLLCCRSDGDGVGPMPVKDVHQSKSNQLRRLVEEIMPSLDALASETWAGDDGKTEYSREDMPDDDIRACSIGSVQDILDYLKTYSMSISGGNVIPSRDLAMREIHDRNGLLLSLMRARAGENDEGKTSEHINLIRQIAGEEIFAQCLEANITGARKGQSNTHPDESCQRIKFTSSNLEFLLHPTDVASNDSSTAQSAVIVGAGMIGSSIAYHLSMRGVKVTVMDQNRNLLPPGEDDDGCEDHDIDPGIATSSSFGWLNANDKSPLSYKQLNQMGMEVWRRHDVLKHAPVWCGSLVRTARHDGREAARSSPHYSRVGPLELEEARRLEPGVEWPSVGTTINSSDESQIHFYPEEGHVDPLEAVKELRSSARRNGVDFVGGAQINNLIRDETGKVVGVEYNIISAHPVKPSKATADIVVIAAGANSSNPVLGVGPDHLQLLDQPGVLAYALTSNSSMEKGWVLQRIFVDTIAQAHMLRRTDNTIVIGGGQLVVGGNDDKTLHSTNTQEGSRKFILREDNLLGHAMVENAVMAMLPHELQPLPASAGSGYELVRVSRANRPVPYDGLPVLGFVEQGLYVAVTHSGITLGPLIGELSAYEVWRNNITPALDGHGMAHRGFRILDTYRPSQTRASSVQNE